MMLSEKLTRKPSTTSSSYRLLFLVLMAGLALAMAFSMVFAGDAEAKKKKKKKKRTPARSAIAAPGTTSPHPADVYSGEHVVRAWGFNQFGQLGDETYTERNTPVQVKNLSGVKAMAAGQVHSLALKEDGTVWAWGHNYSGQLGDGTTTNRHTPVQVQNLGGVKAIASGNLHNLALKTDGTVFAWGRNYGGELGDGTSGNHRYTPVQVKNLQGVQAITAGGYHNLAKVLNPPVVAPQ